MQLTYSRSRRDVMPIVPLFAKDAFDGAKTRLICDAFDGAWGLLQGVDSELVIPAKATAVREILAKRIIDMAQRGMVDMIELRDDALRHLRDNPPAA
jgi:hypothetical protein